MALYPPVIASAMPPFIGQTVKVYFTLSNYNNINEIAQAHVSVRRQNSNVNVVGIEGGTEILLKSIQEEENQSSGEKKYYITINQSELIGKKFELDALYKVQIRFSSVPGQNTALFFTDNYNKFSEWSTVCLIKRINEPSFYIDEFTTDEEKGNNSANLGFEENENTYYSSIPDFNIVYKNEYTQITKKTVTQEDGTVKETEETKTIKSSENLRKWRLRLKDNTTDEIVVDSGENIVTVEDYINSTDGLVIFCHLPYELKNGKDYTLILNIETRNGYIDSKDYNFTVQISEYDAFMEGTTLTAAVNEEEGYIKVQAHITDPDYTGNIVIRRADLKYNQLKWDDVKYFIGKGQPEEINFYDFTVQSGTFYKYLIQKVDIRGRRGTPVQLSKQVMGEWEYAFLLDPTYEITTEDELESIKQLKLKFDFNLSTYKYNVLESKTDTLGSQFPFIRRNGDTYYRSFGCSGLISGFMDNANLFTDEDKLYKNKKGLYNEFKGQLSSKQGSFVNKYDYIYEKKFRDKVMEFLYDNKPKLYKSTQEGNMLIKLMDISLTPKTQLDRLIYTFSATAYEIDETDIQTLINYGFIIPGHYDPDLKKSFSTIGSLSGYSGADSYADPDHPKTKPFKAGQELIGADNTSAANNSVAKNIHYNETFNGNKVDSFKVNWLRVIVEDEPYIIVKNGDSYIPFESEPDAGDNLHWFSQQPNDPNKNYYLGTLMYVNKQPIIIAPPNDTYQISDVPITSLSFAKDTKAIVDYQTNYTSIVDSSLTPKKIRTSRTNGQLTGLYKNKDIIPILQYKYKFSYNNLEENTKIEKSLQQVKSILIDTEPDTVISVRTSLQNTEINFKVNHTGQLNIDLLDSTASIKSYKILGRLDNNNEYKEVEAYIYYCALLRGEYY